MILQRGAEQRRLEEKSTLAQAMDEFKDAQRVAGKVRNNNTLIFVGPFKMLKCGIRSRPSPMTRTRMRSLYNSAETEPCSRFSGTRLFFVAVLNKKAELAAAEARAVKAEARTDEAEASLSAFYLLHLPEGPFCV